MQASLGNDVHLDCGVATGVVDGTGVNLGNCHLDSCVVKKRGDFLKVSVR